MLSKTFPIVVGSEDVDKASLKTMAHLPKCFEQFASQRFQKNKITGYIQDGRWKSVTCDDSYLTPSVSRLACINHKTIYFFGDSTIRQFFVHFASGLQVHGPDNSVIWQQPRYARSAVHQHINTSLFYRAHSPPLLNPGPPNTRPYISDSIIDLPEGGSDVFVIFNIGTHMYFFHPSYFIRRLKGIKAAIWKHQEKYPDTKFMLCGMNVVESNTAWKIYILEELLRQIFVGTKNLVYLNFWDVTTVLPLNDFHPKSPQFDQEARIVMSYICSP